MNIRDKFVRSFAFYAAYHQHPVNQAIHITTIPFIMFTILVWLAYWSPYQIPTHYEVTTNLLSLNLGLVLILIYNTIYIVLDVFAGILYIPFVLILYGGANLFRHYVPYAWAIAIAVHIVAWIIQFLGHGVWEKRKPALFDSLIQAFLMAPFFIFMEILFKCGYNKDLQEDISYYKQQHLMSIQYLV
jgi:2-hydroxy fatty acid dioxygenase